MVELIHLRNKIQNINENDSKNENEEDQLKSKCKILISFKNIISNLEIINEYMKVLRTKGSSLPIKITIKILINDNKPYLRYYLNKMDVDFKEIRDFFIQC